MSKPEIRIQATELASGQEWTSDPDMIEVVITADLVEKAEQCVAFMQTHDVAYMVIYWAMRYTLYGLTECFDEDELAGKTIVTGEDGKQYVEFTPEYRLDGCHTKIYKDGDLFCLMPFKHTADSLSGRVADIPWLKAQLAAEETVPA